MWETGQMAVEATIAKVKISVVLPTFAVKIALAPGRLKFFIAWKVQSQAIMSEFETWTFCISRVIRSTCEYPYGVKLE